MCWVEGGDGWKGVMGRRVICEVYARIRGEDCENGSPITLLFPRAWPSQSVAQKSPFENLKSQLKRRCDSRNESWAAALPSEAGVVVQRGFGGPSRCGRRGVPRGAECGKEGPAQVQ